jgi:hypothetical protein
MNHSIWLATATLAGLGIAFPAQAMPLEKPDAIQTTMQDVVMLNRQTNNELTRIADQINQRLNPEDENAPSVADILPPDFLDGLLDENGEVNLPLGLRVYDAMGATSIGFGSDLKSLK